MKIVIGDGIVEESSNAPVPVTRNFKNFLAAYIGYTENQEASEKLHLWTAISIVAGALERKVYLRRAHYTIFPNLYVVIVGAAGLVKKSTATSIGMDLLRELANIKMLSQRVTDAALAESLRRSGEKYTESSGKELQQSALFCYASELTMLLKDTFGIVVEYLTDLYDCQPHDSRKAWTRETKSEGQVKIYGPCINLLGCATPTSVKDCIPVSQMEAGFASRVLFVVETDRPTKYIAIPKHDKALEAVRAKLVDDLKMITAISGEMTMTPEAEAFFEQWYIKFKNDLYDKGTDSRFSGYYGRKDTMVQKLAMVCSVVESADRVIQVQHIQAALEFLEPLEKSMFGLFQNSGKNEQAGITVDIITYIKERGRVAQQDLVGRFIRDMQPGELDGILASLCKLQQIQMSVSGAQCWYSSVAGAKDLTGWTDSPTEDLEEFDIER